MKKNPHQGDKGQDGIILLEVIVALFILGLTFQGGMLFISHIRQQKKQTETLQKQDLVLKSLAHYAMIHGKLPWAADPDAASPAVGLEDRACARQVGVLPFKTLGLPENYSKDGHGHYFIYKVAKTTAALLTVSPIEAYCRASPDIPLVQENPEGPLQNDFLMVALISDPSGSRHPPTVIPSSAPDIKVAWATRNMLITLYGQGSCAPFHQPLPLGAARAEVPRGWGR